MRRINFDAEWKFIQKEIINANKNNLDRGERELLFSLQIFLLREDIAIYKNLKAIYVRKTKFNE